MNDSITNSTQLTAFQIGYISVDTLIAFFAVVGNGFILFIFAKEERLRKKRNYYLMALAVADFLLGLVGVPTSILVLNELMLNDKKND